MKKKDVMEFIKEHKGEKEDMKNYEIEIDPIIIKYFE